MDSTSVRGGVRGGKGKRERVGKWLGGYILKSGGKKTYVIERRWRGEKFHQPTGCTTERAALEELARFEKDRYGYAAGGVEATRLRITDELATEYLDWMLDAGRSPEWSHECNRYLAEWAIDLHGADLKTLNPQRLRALMAHRKKSRRHRIEALKGFCSWLRKEKGLLTRANDPAMDLPVPPASPAKLRRQRFVEPARILKVLPLLPEEVRQVLIFQMGTGAHVSEVRRFAESGALVTDPDGIAAAIAVFKHKRGDDHAVPLPHAEHLEAAKALIARGKAPSRWMLYLALREACAAAKVERFGLGQLRHSVGTDAVKRGADPAEVAKFLGHSEDTFRRYYLGVPAAAKPIPVLRVVQGKG